MLFLKSTRTLIWQETVKGIEGGVKWSLANATVLHTFPTQTCDYWLHPSVWEYQNWWCLLWRNATENESVYSLQKWLSEGLSACSEKSCWSEPWQLAASASHLFFLTAPSALFVSIFPPLSHPSLQSCPSLFFLFSFCSTNSPKKSK